MPEGLGLIIGLLALGYLMVLAELFVPGGVVGFLGVVAVVWGCKLAFDLGVAWGLVALGSSVVVTSVLLKMIFSSRAGKSLVLSDTRPRTWKASEADLEGLLGKRGRTLSALRPAGVADIEGRRVDVVADSEFLDAGCEVEVSHIEGNRVLVARASAPQVGPETS